MTVRHFLLTHDDSIEEFSEEEAARVASGDTPLPRFADKRLRYLQVSVEQADESGQIQVRTVGAVVGFDEEGRLQEAAAPEDETEFTSFEHDACVQFALKDTVPGRYALN
ncbi:hypothetical protein [Salinisphaera sp. PC39]|uniref:hypothetical protein n=1 Tax=Salinisphaera sp. PC39 TaxID=1304156 RepID=UPI00334074CF